MIYLLFVFFAGYINTDKINRAIMQSEMNPSFSANIYEYTRILSALLTEIELLINKACHCFISRKYFGITFGSIIIFEKNEYACTDAPASNIIIK